MAVSSTSSISGIVSGIDYQSLVNSIISLAQKPADRLKQQAADLQSQQTAIATYKGLLQTLQSAAQTLRDGTAFGKLAATTAIASGTRLTASASASMFATPGSYQVGVTQLAQQQKLGSTPQASATTPAGVAGTFTINGVSVSVLATDTLSDIRDKINAANTGTTRSGVSTSVVTTAPGQSRLILTSAQAGEAGMTLADTTGTALQSLGLLTAPTTLNPAAVLVAGQSAQFTVDGISVVSTSNVVTTAIEGVTLTLTSAEVGAATTVTVSRSASDAQTAVQAFVDAYNAVVDFITQQQTAPKTGDPAPPLLGDNLLRLPKSGLPQALLTSIAGVSPDLSTAAMAGLSLSRNGKLTLNGGKFTAAFNDRFDDLMKLFQQAGTSTGTSTYYVTSGSRTPPGTYAVNITQAATQSQAVGSGLGGTYADDGTDDTMTVTDSLSKKSVSVTLTNGMTSAQIVTALNSAFGVNGLGLVASDRGGEVTITQSAWGASPAITVAYTAGGALGNAPIAAGTYANGLDVAGTINGEAASGSGQVLIAKTGTTGLGLVVRYTGSTTGSAGDVTVTLGTGALLERLVQSYTDVNTGTLDTRNTSLTDRVKTLNARADRIKAQLDVRKTALLKQYAAMEQALGNLQSQSQSITAMMNALTNNSGSGKNG
jgi:flagellar hook-associated protein 2